MLCPKCSHPMNRLPADLPADGYRCSHCHGLWLQAMAYERLQPYAAQVDTGDPEVGHQYNRVDRIHCPYCPGEQDLIRMVDPEQPHIWFESCQSCFGRFYDAGEFADLAEHSFSEWLRDLDAPERPL